MKENLEKNYKVLNEKLLAGEREELFKGKS